MQRVLRRPAVVAAPTATPTPSELAVRIDDRISAVFVIAVTAFYIAIFVYAIFLGGSGLLTPTPTPRPTASAPPVESPSESASPSASTSLPVSAAPSASAEPSASPAPSASAEPSAVVGAERVGRAQRLDGAQRVSLGELTAGVPRLRGERRDASCDVGRSQA